MTCSPFQIRIGGSLPTRFDAQVDGYGHHRWDVQRTEALLQSLERQCSLLAEDIDKATGGKVIVRWQLLVRQEVVQRIRSLNVKTKLHEIVTPDPQGWTQDGRLKGATTFYFWIPFNQDLFARLSRSQQRPHINSKSRFIWLPCAEAAEIDREDFRLGLKHELAHWLKRRVEKTTTLRDLPGVDQRGDLYGALRKRLTCDHVKALCAAHNQEDDRWS